MNVLRCCFVLLLALFLPLSVSSQIFSDSGFSVETVAQSGPYSVIGFAWASDGRMFTWSKGGTVHVVKDGAVIGTFLDISARVNIAVDRGLIGFALDPNFSSNGYVYLAYVYEPAGDPNAESPRTQRVSRFKVSATNPDMADPASETVLLGKVTDPACTATADCIPNDIGTHTVDHLAFGPDGKLYVSVGDGASYKFADPHALRAQNLDSLNGKILRINVDGTAPNDNPFYDGTNSNRSKVYAYGLRNPYRFWIDFQTGVVWAGDVGWASWEEINTGRGKNFGWPCYEGASPQVEYQAALPECAQLQTGAVTMPFYTYAHQTGSAITLGPLFRGANYPAQYQDNLFYTDYDRGSLYRVIRNADGTLNGAETVAEGIAGPVYVTQGPDGRIYVNEFPTGRILRLKHTASGSAVLTVRAAADKTSGLSPLTVNFTSTAVTGSPIAYAWDFGDGQTSSSPNPQHRFDTSGTVRAFDVTLRTADAGGNTSIDQLRITVGSTPPAAAIVKPQSDLSARPGTVINFSGRATDAEDGSLPATALRWRVFLHHNDHVHVVKDFTGSGGSFIVESHDSIDPYSYEVALTAIDSSGLTDNKSVRIGIESAAPACPLPSAAGVAICTPAAGAAVTSPLRVTASARSATGNLIVAWRGYANGKEVLAADGAAVDQPLSLPDGRYQFILRAWDAAGAYVDNTIAFTVGSGSSGTGPCATALDSVKICSPAATGPVTSTFQLSAGADASYGIAAMKAYLDYKEVASSANGSLEAQLTATAGTHVMVVNAWDFSGAVRTSELAFTVSGATGGVTCVATPNTVNICAPANGVATQSPFEVLAAANSSRPLATMKVYLDGQEIAVTQGASIYTQLSAGAGSHQLVAQAWDTSGTLYRTETTFTVTAPSGGASCEASAIGVVICSPADAATVGSTVTISAAAKGEARIVAVKAYLNAQEIASAQSASLTKDVTATTGTHMLTVNAWDRSGKVYTKQQTFTVGQFSSVCSPSLTNFTITVCQPMNNATVLSPVHFVARTSSTEMVTAMRIYADGSSAYTANADRIDTNLPLSRGTHSIVIQAWTVTGRVIQARQTINVQ